MKNRSIPDSWTTVALSEVAESMLGKMLDKSKHKTGRKLPYLRNVNVRWNDFDLSDVADMFFREEELDRYAVRSGDVLVCEGGEPGRSAVWIGKDGLYKYQKALHRVRPHETVTPSWISFALKRDAESGRLKDFFTGSTIKHLTGKSLSRWDFPLPPLNEQRRIIASVEALQSRTTSAREALDAIPPLLEKFRQSVLAAAFRGDLTREWRARNPEVEPASVLLERIETPPRPNRFKSRSQSTIEGKYALAVGRAEMPAPAGWQWTLLLDVAQLESGHTPSRQHPEYWGGDIPWVSIPDARDNHGSVITETRNHVTEEGIANSASRVIPAGATFLCRTAASIGYTLVLGCPMATSQDLVAWIPTEAVNPKFLMWLFIAEKESILRFGRGSAHKTVYFPEILSFHVCLPPREEQDEIVARVEKRMADARRIELAMQEASARLPIFDQSILAKAFRGELVPQDPNDEPASVLLDRIRAEREAAEAEAKAKKKATRRPRKKAAKKKAAARKRRTTRAKDAT